MIHLELHLDPDYDFDGTSVNLKALRFPGCQQNLLPYLSHAERVQAECAVIELVERDLKQKVEAAAELRELRGDWLRDQEKDDKRVLSG